MDTLSFDDYTVRPIETVDAPAYFTLIEANRPRLEDFFAGTVSRTKTLADTGVFIADAVERRHARTYFPFIVTQGDEIAGFIDVKNIDWNIPKAELGCFIGKAHEGKGISSKALALVIEYLFATHHFNKLFLRTHPTNAPARALAEKCGFVVEGIIRRDYKTTRGELVDLVYYGLLSS
jgi:ribosomal-protein-serine acetyltransferase